MTFLNRSTLAAVFSCAVAAFPAAAQQRELPRQPPAEPMQGMMQGRGMMGMMGRGGDAAGRERPQLTLEGAEEELAALLKRDAAAGSQVEAKVRAIEKLRADLRLERIRTIAEGRATLNPEQRAKLDQLAAGSGPR